MKASLLSAAVFGLAVACVLPAPPDQGAPPKTFMDLPLLFVDDFESGKAIRERVKRRG
ncbi:MAG: hypothetical protein HY000_18945 [Planctomycetes bacterium]|nr:hypothetical protein [Planctomycetota bacterium]